MIKDALVHLTLLISPLLGTPHQAHNKRGHMTWWDGALWQDQDSSQNISKDFPLSELHKRSQLLALQPKENWWIHKNSMKLMASAGRNTWSPTEWLFELQGGPTDLQILWRSSTQVEHCPAAAVKRTYTHHTRTSACRCQSIFWRS